MKSEKKGKPSPEQAQTTKELCRELIERKLIQLADEEKKMRAPMPDSTLWRMANDAKLNIITLKRETLQEILDQAATIENMLKPTAEEP